MIAAGVRIAATRESCSLSHTFSPVPQGCLLYLVKRPTLFCRGFVIMPASSKHAAPPQVGRDRYPCRAQLQFDVIFSFCVERHTRTTDWEPTQPRRDQSTVVTPRRGLVSNMHRATPSKWPTTAISRPAQRSLPFVFIEHVEP
jgi:hypothetical protein